LRAFTSEEKLEQGYHCSRCKTKQPATKKLQLWKLPPILVNNLKFGDSNVITIFYFYLIDCSPKALQLRQQ
jgi:ubiquitin C-terminal hydrolase